MKLRLPVLLGSVLVAGLMVAGAAAEPTRSVLNVDYNQDETGPGSRNLNSLDLYLPAKTGAKGVFSGPNLRP